MMPLSILTKNYTSNMLVLAAVTSTPCHFPITFGALNIYVHLDHANPAFFSILLTISSTGTTFSIVLMIANPILMLALTAACSAGYLVCNLVAGMPHGLVEGAVMVGTYLFLVTINGSLKTGMVCYSPFLFTSCHCCSLYIYVKVLCDCTPGLERLSVSLFR